MANNRPREGSRFRQFLTPAMALALAGCGTTNQMATAPNPIGWEEIVTVTATEFKPNPRILLEDAQVTPERLSRMPQSLRHTPVLAQLAVKRALDKPIPYQSGILGHVGSARLFVARTRDIPDYDRLYWVMVRVLSEKYGCFLRSRVKRGDVMTFVCRDTRRIVLWRSMGRDWIQFYARQFDAEGFEIEVRKRRIIRISSEQILGAPAKG